MFIQRGQRDVHVIKVIEPTSSSEKMSQKICQKANQREGRASIWLGIHWAYFLANLPAGCKKTVLLSVGDLVSLDSNVRWATHYFFPETTVKIGRGFWRQFLTGAVGREGALQHGVVQQLHGDDEHGLGGHIVALLVAQLERFERHLQRHRFFLYSQRYLGFLSLPKVWHERVHYWPLAAKFDLGGHYSTWHHQSIKIGLPIKSKEMINPLFWPFYQMNHDLKELNPAPFSKWAGQISLLFEMGLQTIQEMSTGSLLLSYFARMESSSRMWLMMTLSRFSVESVSSSVLLTAAQVARAVELERRTHLSQSRIPIYKNMPGLPFMAI